MGDSGDEELGWVKITLKPFLSTTWLIFEIFHLRLSDTKGRVAVGSGGMFFRKQFYTDTKSWDDFFQTLDVTKERATVSSDGMFFLKQF